MYLENKIVNMCNRGPDYKGDIYDLLICLVIALVLTVIIDLICSFLTRKVRYHFLSVAVAYSIAFALDYNYCVASAINVTSELVCVEVGCFFVLFMSSCGIGCIGAEIFESIYERLDY